MDKSDICFERIITKDNFVQMETNLKFGVIYDFMNNIDARLNNIEKQLTKFKVKSSAWAAVGGILGGALAVFYLKFGGF